jgi:hypothetical protein
LPTAPVAIFLVDFALVLCNLQSFLYFQDSLADTALSSFLLPKIIYSRILICLQKYFLPISRNIQVD